MNREEILENLRILSKHQGFYSSIYTELSRKTLNSETILDELEKRNFKDIADLCLYFES